MTHVSTPIWSLLKPGLLYGFEAAGPDLRKIEAEFWDLRDGQCRQ